MPSGQTPWRLPRPTNRAQMPEPTGRATAPFWGPLDTPPMTLVLLSALQQVLAAAPLLTYPLLVAQAAGASPQTTASFISLTLLATGAATLLQCHRLGPVGSGFLCWPSATVLYLVPSLAAAKIGGLSLVLGMTLVAALIQVALAPLMRRLRPLFPPEIAGIVVLLVGITSGAMGVRMIASAGPLPGAAIPPIAAALLALAVMTALNVWGRGALHIGCVLVGAAAGMLASVRFGMAGEAVPPVAVPVQATLFAWPDTSHLGWSFHAALLVPYAVSALAAAIKTSGSIVILQSACDPRWVRADMRSVSGGVLADGLGTMLSAGIGGLGLNTSSSAAGLAAATGMHSRRIASAIALMCLLLGLSPALGLLLMRIPEGVLGAALVFSAAYMIVNGVQIVTSRLLDTRRTFVIGLGVLAGLSVELAPAMIEALPPAARSMFGTPLVFGTLVALGMNLIFRIGATRVGRLRVEPDTRDTAQIDAWIHALGAAWGARRDVIERVAFGVAQAVEVLCDDAGTSGPIDVSASFDEFNVRVRMSWQGPPLEFPEQRPSADEIIASEDGTRRLAGFLLRRIADRVSCAERAGRSTLTLRFDH